MILFLCGLTFFTMGIAILARTSSVFELTEGRRFTWLGAFGVMHGAYEWMLAATRVGLVSVMPRIAVAPWGAVSFIALLGFSLDALGKTAPRRLMVYAAVCAAAMAASVELLGVDGEVLSRWALGAPASLLAGGVLVARRARLFPDARAERALACAGAAFVVYGVLTLVVPHGRAWVPAALDADAFLRATGVPVQVPRGACAAVITASVLVTLGAFAESERARAESALRKTEEQLRQAQRMEAVGRLAGGVAHDFNNMLSVILSYATLLLDEAPSDAPYRDDVREIKSAGERAARLTRQLLAFSRRQVLEPRMLDLNHTLDTMTGMVERLLGEDVQLAVSHGAALGTVFADPGQIEQVIMNLVVNARDAMPDGGKLRIETRNVELGAGDAAVHRGVAPGRYVLVAVTDTGTGMDAATRDRIFEPFFTTKEQGKGTGLGLAMVFGIVKQSGGHIGVYSEPGKGARFEIYLPRTDGAPDAVSPTSSLPRPLRGNETVLLVEDDDMVRASTRAVLLRNGYHVLECSGGEQALTVAAGHDARIDMLVTDVVMPHMNGRQLAERVAQKRRGIRVLYLSGYTGSSIVHDGVLDPGVAFLQKPVTPRALLAKMREVLERAA